MMALPSVFTPVAGKNPPQRAPGWLPCNPLLWLVLQVLPGSRLPSTFRTKPLAGTRALQ